MVTEHLLDRRMHENAFDIAVRGRKFDEVRMDRPPPLAIDIQGIAQHGNRHHLLALVSRQEPVWHGCEPNVGVQADLMA